ncbi:hypothetical protein BpHYR1_021503 [Brachionus plicatilis]|uniref:Uncharacterized protein n=1 Tax=Brachionus plicatilis TaxID=10195 RepID=A0A3M7Q0T3_BRAPC|nr:hypothetical protein BpHYR1_021503 [Brachionus plicatilis]
MVFINKQPYQIASNLTIQRDACKKSILFVCVNSGADNCPKYAEKVTASLRNESTNSLSTKIKSKETKSQNFVVESQQNSDLSSAVRPPELFDYYAGLVTV